MTAHKLRLPTELLLAGVALLYASLTFATALGLVRTPYQFNYEEGNILNAGVRIVHGQSPYPPPQQWPIVLNPYGPVGYYSTAAAIRATGLSFAGPRMIVAACGLITSILIALLMQRFGATAPSAVAFGALFLWVPISMEWLPVLRVDLLGLTAVLAGMYVLSRRKRRWLLAATLFAIALATKPTFLAAPAAAVVLGVIEKRGREALRLAAATAAISAAVFGVFAIATHGAFLFHLLRTHPDPLDRSMFLEAMRYILVAQPLSVLLALLFVVAEVRRRCFSLPLLYLAFALLMAVVTSGKLGSDSNHLLEITAALCWAAGLGWNIFATGIRRPGWRAAVPAAAVALAIYLAWQYVPLAPRSRAGCEQAYQYVRTHGERILSENVGAVVLAGKPVQVSNPFVYTQLAVHGGGSDRELQDRLRQRWFDLVVLSRPVRDYEAEVPDDRWSREVLRAMGENYRAVQSFECPGAGVAMVPR